MLLFGVDRYGGGFGEFTGKVSSFITDELDDTRYCGVDGVIGAETGTVSRAIMAAALTDNNLTRLYRLSAENFDAKALTG